MEMASLDLPASFKEFMRQLRTPLNEASRKVRRDLLAVSTIALVIVKVGLVPTEIAQLGIKFSPTDQTVLLRLLAGIIVYFLISFTLYSWSELLAWLLTRRSLRESVKDEFATRLGSSKEAEMMLELAKRRSRGHILYEGTLWLRFGLDIAFPVLLSLYSILILIF